MAQYEYAFVIGHALSLWVFPEHYNNGMASAAL